MQALTGFIDEGFTYVGKHLLHETLAVLELLCPPISRELTHSGDGACT